MTHRGLWLVSAGWLVGALALLPQLSSAATLAVTTRQKDGSALTDTVIYLDPQTPNKALPIPEPLQASVAQSGMQFVPYITVVRTGAAVSFPNLDAVDHHVKSFSPAKPFELKVSSTTLPPVIFDQSGVVALNCLLHDWMRGYILILDSPFYAQIGPTGKAQIDNIPPGAYVAHAWHPDLGNFMPSLEQTVTIKEGSQELVFDFPFNARPRKMPKHM